MDLLALLQSLFADRGEAPAYGRGGPSRFVRQPPYPRPAGYPGPAAPIGAGSPMAAQQAQQLAMQQAHQYQQQLAMQNQATQMQWQGGAPAGQPPANAGIDPYTQLQMVQLMKDKAAAAAGGMAPYPSQPGMQAAQNTAAQQIAQQAAQMGIQNAYNQMKG